MCICQCAEDVPAMYEQSEPNGPNGGSEALQFRICDSKWSEQRCDLQVHSWRG